MRPQRRRAGHSDLSCFCLLLRGGFASISSARLRWDYVFELRTVRVPCEAKEVPAADRPQRRKLNGKREESNRGVAWPSIAALRPTPPANFTSPQMGSLILIIPAPKAKHSIKALGFEPLEISSSQHFTHMTCRFGGVSLSFDQSSQPSVRVCSSGSPLRH